MARIPHPLLKFVMIGLVILGFVNFVAYSLSATLIGGDAVNGKVADGHYYVALHGKLTEVSPTVFHYSLLHTKLLLVTHVLAMLASYWLYRFAGYFRKPR